MSFSRADFAAGGEPITVAIGDLNGDGKADLAVACTNDKVWILLGTGTGSFGPPTGFAVGIAVQSVAIGDLNDDGKPDLAVTVYSSPPNVSVLLGDGTGAFGAPTKFAVGAYPVFVAIADLNGDGKPDLAVANYASNNVSILLGTGTGSFGPATNFAVGVGPYPLAIADLNGDGKPDLAVANYDSSNISILLGTGTGSFGAATNFAVGPHPHDVAIGDLNGDEKLDLVTANNNSSGTVSILLGDGTGSFGPATNFAAGTYLITVAIGDFNGDGALDLAMANGGGVESPDTVSILLGDGTGTFGPATSFAVGREPSSAPIGDLNGDGKPDLAVGNILGDTISILLNTTTWPLAEVTVTAPNGGESWAAGTTHGITWTYTGNPGSQVKVELLKGGALNATISSGTSVGTNGSGSFSWAVPGNQASGSDYRVRITSNQDTQYTDTSDAGFTIEPSPAPPTAVSVTPNAGAGTSQTFSLLYSDGNGAADLRLAYVMINSSLTWAGSCGVYYDNALNALYLVQDGGGGWFGPATPGAVGTLTNSQCTLNVGTSSVSKSGNNLTVNLALSFKPAFAGTKNIYMNARDRGSLLSGWQTRGSWNTGAPVAPQAVSVTPSSGSGASQTFSLLYSDGNGYGDIRLAYVLFNTQISAASSCQAYYDNAGNRVYLRNDAGTGFLGPATIGQAGTVQNSQCTLDAGASSVAKSGNNLTVNLAVSFKPAFTGTKNIYMYVTDREGLASGWQQRGTWNTSAPLAPQAISVTPNAGAGTSRVFWLLYADGNGFADLRLAYVMINSSLAWAGSCGVYYDHALNALYLVQDSGGGWFGPLTPGQAGTLQNSQCTLDAGTSSLDKQGNNLRLNVALSFKPAFAGTKSIFMNARDNGGLLSGWQTRGSWNTSAPVAPQAVSVTPNAGSGTSRTFSLLYSDGNGYGDIRLAYVLIHTQVSAASSCQAYYDNATNAAYLRNDAGTSFLGPLIVGQAGTLQNSQCTIDAGASSVVKSGNNLTLNLAVSFKPAFAGAKNIYMYVTDREGMASGWQMLGSWTAP